MKPHQPNQLVAPELNYRYLCLQPDGASPVPLSEYESAILKMWVVLVVEIAMEQMKCAATQ